MKLALCCCKTCFTSVVERNNAWLESLSGGCRGPELRGLSYSPSAHKLRLRTACGPSRTCRDVRLESVVRTTADIALQSGSVRPLLAQGGRSRATGGLEALAFEGTRARFQAGPWSDTGTYLASHHLSQPPSVPDSAGVLLMTKRRRCDKLSR